MLRALYARGVNLGMNCFIPHGVNGTVDSLRYTVCSIIIRMIIETQSKCC